LNKKQERTRLNKNKTSRSRVMHLVGFCARLPRERTTTGQGTVLSTNLNLKEDEAYFDAKKKIKS
jgi:hypothetical protein